MVRSLLDSDEFLVGTLQSDEGVSWDSSFLSTSTPERGIRHKEQNPLYTQLPMRSGGELFNPTLAGTVIACITSPRGVWTFDSKYLHPVAVLRS